MAGLNRKPFQGIGNIIRFNWHFYVLALLAVVTVAGLAPYIPKPIAAVVIVLIAIAVLTSLAVSFYIYDYSDLYTLKWLDNLSLKTGNRIVNIHAGFDETSALLAHKYPNASLTVLDFYDPVKHTEVSVKRARKAYPPYTGTCTIQTSKPITVVSNADCIFLIFAAHEIRDNGERIAFFKHLRNTLAGNGRIVVTEHLRDLANLLAYNAGAFHFLPKSIWHKTFAEAGLAVENADRINPFVTNYILKKDGNTP